MIFREFIRNLAYSIAGIPVIGKPVIFMLNFRRKILYGNQLRSSNSEIATTEGSVKYLASYEDALKGVLECLQRQENRIRILEERLKEKNGD